MLGLEIQEFIEALRVQQTIGCILIPEKDLQTLRRSLEEAGIYFGNVPNLNSPHAFLIRKREDLIPIKAPGILILSEEHYSKDPELAEKVREKADYFINAKKKRPTRVGHTGM